jgi:hypothetical protein
MIHAQHGTRRAPHVYFGVGKDERYWRPDRYQHHALHRLQLRWPHRRRRSCVPSTAATRGPGQAAVVRFFFIRMHRPAFRDKYPSELLP